MTLVPRVVELLREQDAGDVVVTVGGTIPSQDIPELKKLGVAEVFTPGAPTQAIIDFIRRARSCTRVSCHRPDGIVKGVMPVALLLSSPSSPKSPRPSRCAIQRRLHAPWRRCIVVVVGYGISFWLLALVLREMSVGSTYAIWSAAGTALVATFGMFALGEAATALKLASLGLIIIGVVGLNLAGRH